MKTIILIQILSYVQKILSCSLKLTELKYNVQKETDMHHNVNCWFVRGRIKAKISTYICHKVSSVLYGKYSTVVKKYSTVNVILIIVCVNNPP